MKVGLILLAGGKGTRMGNSIPKQFLPLKDIPVALYSLAVFDTLELIQQSVIVVDPVFEHLFPNRVYARPGDRRQDSVWNGLQALDPACEFVCIHDAARPFITNNLVENVLSKAFEMGAATSAVPLKFSIKQADADGRVKSSLDRSTIWEIQTPQVIRRDLLEKGFAIAHEKNLTVTDDVGLVELFNHPVQLVMGSHSNLKLTTPEDFEVARGRYGL